MFDIRFLHRTGFAITLLLAASSVAAQFQPFQPLPAQPPIPADNPQSALKIELGAQLYFDPRLSVNGTVTCNTCHNLLAGGDDERPLSIGATGVVTARNAPSLFNVGYYTIYFRDGRATSLEAAIEEHLADEVVLGNKSHDQVLARLRKLSAYGEEFAKVFGDGEISGKNVAQALAAYLRSMNTTDSAFDQYLRGRTAAISEQAKSGLKLFNESACASCHFYVNMAGPVPGLAFQMGEGFYELFPNFVGSEYDTRYQLMADIGRYQVTKIDTDKRMWRVTSLRNVATTAPYFHNGSVANLDEAVRVMAKVQLNLTWTDQQVADVVAFLQTLTGEFPRVVTPRLPTPNDGTVYQN